MSKFQTLRAFVNQRLTLATEEIFELFERTMGEYEEELCRQHKLLDAVFKPEVRLHREDVQQLSVRKEKVPPKQKEWSPLLDQEEQLELPHIKAEQEELWSSQEREQLQRVEEADITKITFTPVSLKSDEDKEEPQSSLLHQRQTQQIKTEDDGEDCGGPEPAKNLNLDSHLQPATHEQTSHPSEPETDVSCDWEETREPQTGFSPLQDNEEPVSDMKCNIRKSSECATNKRQRHNGKKEGKRFSCSVCEKNFRSQGDLARHMRVHTGEKPFSCDVCEKRFSQSSTLATHLRIHTRERPFICSTCKRSFSSRETMVKHMMTHIREKPFSCSLCDMKYATRDHLKLHMRGHTGEKPFGCSVCGMRFRRKDCLEKHKRIHTGEKPFSCSVCGKRFTQRAHVTAHLRVHMGEKTFSCSVCKKGFSSRSYMFSHMRTHKGEKPLSCFL